MKGNGKTLVRSSLLRPSLFEDMLRPMNEWLDERWPFSSHLPAVNVKETDKSYEITMAAPGLDKKDFNIDVNGSMITISAEKEKSEEEKEDGPPELLFVHGGHTDRPSDISWNLNERLMLASTADDNILQVWQIAYEQYYDV